MYKESHYDMELKLLFQSKIELWLAFYSENLGK